MINFVRAICAILLVCGVIAADVQPPQPNYERYGSYSRQLAVYENARNLENDLELRKYRRFREEVRRTTPQASYYVVGNGYYGRSTCGVSYGACGR